MLINVSTHSVEQYRNKMLDFTSSDERIRDILAEIIRKGAKIHNRPQACEIKYRKLSVVAKIFPNEIVVVTFLGDERYRSWYRKHKVSRKKAS